MPETNIWTGTSSPWENFWTYVIALALTIVGAAGYFGIGIPDAYQGQRTLFLIPIAVALLLWITATLRRRSRVYQLTSERIIVKIGVFGRRTEAVELYRVRDIEVLEPFISRIVGLQTIRLVNTDNLNPTLILADVPARLKLGDTLRQQVEACRVTKRVRDVDIDVSPHL